LSAALLLIGTIGVLTRRNIVIILMSIELILKRREHQPGRLFAARAEHGRADLYDLVITDAVAEAADRAWILIAVSANKETVQADQSTC